MRPGTPFLSVAKPVDARERMAGDGPEEGEDARCLANMGEKCRFSQIASGKTSVGVYWQKGAPKPIRLRKKGSVGDREHADHPGRSSRDWSKDGRPGPSFPLGFQPVLQSGKSNPTLAMIDCRSTRWGP